MRSKAQRTLSQDSLTVTKPNAAYFSAEITAAEKVQEHRGSGDS